MIKMTFARDGNIMKIVVVGKIITLQIGALNYQPFQIDLSKLGEPETISKLEKMKMDDEESKKLLFEISKLETEKEICDDIKKDFQKKKWRMISRNGLN